MKYEVTDGLDAEDYIAYPMDTIQEGDPVIYNDYMSMGLGGMNMDMGDMGLDGMDMDMGDMSLGRHGYGRNGHGWRNAF